MEKVLNFDEFVNEQLSQEDILDESILGALGVTAGLLAVSGAAAIVGLIIDSKIEKKKYAKKIKHEEDPEKKKKLKEAWDKADELEKDRIAKLNNYKEEYNKKKAVLDEKQKKEAERKLGMLKRDIESFEKLD